MVYKIKMIYYNELQQEKYKMNNYQFTMTILSHVMKDGYHLITNKLIRFGNNTIQSIIDYCGDESITETASNLYNHFSDMYHQTINEENMLLCIGPTIFVMWMIYRFLNMFVNSTRQYDVQNTRTFSNKQTRKGRKFLMKIKAVQAGKKNQAFDSFVRGVMTTMKSNISNKDKLALIRVTSSNLDCFFRDVKTGHSIPRRNKFRNSRKSVDRV
jgi:hypothetical protein